MIRDTYESIVKNEEVRKNLSKLKQELKEEKDRRALLYYLEGNYEVFERLLCHEDPKTRKNTALVLSLLGDQRLLKPLYEAYEKEETLFVKSAYLIAMKEYDFREYFLPLKEHLAILSKKEITQENKKHQTQELRALSDLLLMLDKVERHIFRGNKVSSELILLTNRNFIDKTIDQLPEDADAAAFNAGVLVTTDNLDDIMKIRTFEEILFVVKGMKNCTQNPEEAARKMAEAGLLRFMEKRHQGKAPFYFRVECKSKMELDKKSILTKKLAAELERLTDRQLINTTSKYEFEIRLVENKTGAFNIMLKLYTLEDSRFDYRIETLPTSIKPVNAALTFELAKDYLKEDATVLDPFCGTGTMLIERHKFKKVNTMYGIDFYAQAIEKAKINTEHAHQIIHYVNRDFFDFEHEYRFDEIIANMPRVIGRKKEEDILLLYQMFFKKAKEHLEEDGILLLYSHNRDMVKKLALPNGFAIQQEWEISKKEGAYIYVLKN